MLASSGLVLQSIRLWKQSFETFAHLGVPVPSAFLGIVGALSLLALVWSRIALSPRFSFKLGQLAKFVLCFCFFLAAASGIVRTDRIGLYGKQEPAAQHFLRLGGGVGWENWEVVSIYQKGRPVNDDDLKPLSQLPQVRSLYLSNTKVTDAGLEHVASLTNLEALYLDNLQVTDDGMAEIAGLTRLNNLWLHNTTVTDAGLVYLRDLTELGYLDLGGCNITDRGLAHLAHLDQLGYLHLPGTKVTKEGIGWLSKRLPNCRIYGTPDGEDYSAGP